MITLTNYLTVSAIVFGLSLAGIIFNRRNLIMLLMCIELLLLAVNINFLAFAHYLGNNIGEVFVFFTLTVAAAEAAIGLAILIVIYRSRGNIDVETLDSLKG